MFQKLCTLLDIADREKSLRRDPDLTEMSALLFWPWAEPLLAAAPPDPYTVLKKAFLDSAPAVALPKGLLAQVIDVLAMVGRMIRALRTGSLRWSVRNRPYFTLASRLCYIVMQERAPGAGESFETLYQNAFPGRPTSGGKPRRRRRRNGGRKG
jgi:hypothetical protein